MANRVSIPASAGQKDPFYRYQRDMLEVRALKNNITEVINLDRVAAHLHTEPAKILRFLASAVGTSALSNGKLRGAFDRSTLEHHLEHFVRAHILCARCGLPELGKRKCDVCGTLIPRA